MRYFHRKGNLAFCPSINLDKVWTLVGDDVRKAHASKTDVAPVIDVTKYVRVHGVQFVFRTVAAAPFCSAFVA